MSDSSAEFDQDRYIDEACDRFEDAWSNGEDPRIETYVEEIDAALRPQLLRQLIMLDIELRSGDSVVEVSDYADRFPADESLVQAAFDDAIQRVAATTTSGLHGEPHPKGFAGFKLERADDDPQSSSLTASTHELGDYQLLSQLGVGGMGDVYKARQVSANRLVALKVIREDRLARLGPPEREAAIQRFRVEAQAAARLQHDHIVTVFDVGQHKGRHYYTMQLVEGGSLAEQITGLVPLDGRTAIEDLQGKAGDAGSVETANADAAGIADESAAKADDTNAKSNPGPQTAPANEPSRFTASVSRQKQIARWMESIARALSEAHRHGILHRDIKPNNILIDQESNRALIADFGLAKLTDAWAEEVIINEATDIDAADIDNSATDSSQHATRAGEVFGSPAYMSPEQATDATTVSTLSDVYSLGATLYHVLCGRAPFEGKRIQDVLKQVVSETPTRPREVVREIHRDLEAMCMKCLRKEPADRYQSAEELADDLARFANGQPVEARPRQAMARVGMWCRRNPLIAGLAAGVVVLFVLSVAGYVSEREQRRLADAATAQAESSESVAVEAFKESEKAKAKEKRLRHQAEKDSALNDLSRGQMLGEAGDAEQGLLWMARALAKLPENELHLERVMRWNLSAWDDRIHPVEQMIRFHGSLNDVHFHPDGKRIATATLYHVHFWDLKTGQNVRPRFPQMNPREFRFNRDGGLMLTINNDKTVRVFSTRTGRDMFPPLKAPGGITSAEFHPLQSRLATYGRDGVVRFWDAQTGRQEELTIRANRRSVVPITRLAWDATGTVILANRSDSSMAAFNATTGRQLPHGFSQGRLLSGVSVHPAQKFVATVGHDRMLKLWDIHNGKPLINPIDLDHIPAAIRSTEDRLVIAFQNRRAGVWDANTFRRIGSNTSVVGSVSSVDIHPNQESFAVAGSTLSMRIRKIAPGDGKTLPHHVFSHAVVNGAKEIIFGTEQGRVEVWDPQELKASDKTFLHDAPVAAVALDQERQRLITAATTTQGPTQKSAVIQVWDYNTAQPIGDAISIDSGVLGIEVSPVAPVAVMRMRMFEVWRLDISQELATAEPLRRKDRKVMARDFQLLSDGRLVTVHSDRFVRVWDLAVGKVIRESQVGRWTPHRFAVSRDERELWIGCTDGTVRRVSLADLKEIGEPLKHPGEIISLATSSDRELLVVGTTDSASVWRTADWSKACNLIGHQDRVTNIAVSHNNAFVITGSNDNTVRVWDPVTGLPIGPPLEHSASIRRIITLPGSRRFFTAGTGKKLVARLLPEPSKLAPQTVKLWAEKRTGMTLNDRNAVKHLTSGEWHDR